MTFFFQGGQHILTLVDFFGGGFIIFALTTLEVVAVAWIYGNLNPICTYRRNGNEIRNCQESYTVCSCIF